MRIAWFLVFLAAAGTAHSADSSRLPPIPAVHLSGNPISDQGVLNRVYYLINQQNQEGAKKLTAEKNLTSLRLALVNVQKRKLINSRNTAHRKFLHTFMGWDPSLSAWEQNIRRKTLKAARVHLRRTLADDERRISQYIWVAHRFADRYHQLAVAIEAMQEPLHAPDVDDLYFRWHVGGQAANGNVSITIDSSLKPYATAAANGKVDINRNSLRTQATNQAQSIPGGNGDSIWNGVQLSR